MFSQMMFVVNDKVILRTLASSSSGGLAGYDVCLTRIRSRVRAPPGVLFNVCYIIDVGVGASASLVVPSRLIGSRLLLNIIEVMGF